MSKERIKLGFDEELEANNEALKFDVKDWNKNKSVRTHEKEHLKEAAHKAGFKSREVEVDKKREPLRRRRTGRNAQFNLKAKPETIEMFCSIADQQGWGLAETFEYAVALLEKEYS